jgi:N-acetylglucosamine-6-sulfatase
MTPSARAGRRGLPAQANFIHICADDMRFDDYKHMPNLKALVRDPGVVFRFHYLTFPMCAPSRASTLTGLQPHNNGVLGDYDPYGYWAYRNLEGNALPVWLANAGYAVQHVGKFINGYVKIGGLHVPPGYSDWRALASNEAYWNFTLNENGSYVTYNSGEYSTDVFVEKVLNFVATAPQPYAVFLWPTCPHDPSTPDTRDLGKFDNVDMPIPANFNELDMSDKPKWMQGLPLLTPDQIAATQDLWRRRQETLLSLDRGIGQILAALKESGQMLNTHIIFTSDNGFFLGEHRLDDEKGYLYEESQRVPLYWLQPSGYRGTFFEPVTNIDVTAAMVELAGATPGRVLDGRSLVPVLRDLGSDWNSATLLQCHASQSVATRHYRYVEWIDNRGIELYDMTIDPAQMQSVAGKPEYAEIQATLAATLQVLRGCAGDSCSWTGKFPPPPT